MSDKISDPFYVEIKELLNKVRKNNDDKASRRFHEEAATIREKIDSKLAEIVQTEYLPLKAEQAYKEGKIEKPRKLEELLPQDQRESKDKKPDFQSEDVIWAILGTEAQSPLYMAYDHLKRDVAIQSKHVKHHD